MAIPTQSTYKSLITSQHATKPKFMATIAAIVQPAIDIQTVLADIAAGVFDLDQAVGVQLDQVGQWIGRSREVVIPLSGVYFALDTPNLGFDQGNWQGQYDPTTGVTLLDDFTYRALLRAKIIMNHWDGSAVMAAQALDMLFTLSPGTYATIQDNQDMSMIVGVSGVVPPAALISMLQNGEFDVNPVGVGITYSITSINTTALFGFDIETNAIAGFDVGAWSGQSGTAPGQVQGFSLVSVSQNTASFSWIAPQTGVGPYTYQLQYTAVGTGIVTNAPITSNTSISISGLAGSQQYSATVYAISSGGPGPSSAPIVFTTTAGAPGQVTGLYTTGNTSSTIGLAWTVLAGATSYQSLYRVSGVGSYLQGPSSTVTSLTITGLQPATVYDVTVYGLNSSGAGTSATLLIVGTSGSIPGAPVSLQTTGIGQSDIAVSWLNPLTGNGPFAFSVQYAQNTTPIVYQPFTGTMSLTANGGACDITNLQSGVQYLIQVAASNLGGVGPYCSPITVTTAGGPPNQVTGLSSSTINPTSVVLNWYAVANATQYQIQYQLAGATTWTNGPLITAPTLTGTVSGLTAGLTYHFRVYAIGP